MILSCIDTPISWLELERYLLGESAHSQRIASHLQQCPACAQVSQSIQSDARTMPALPVQPPAPSKPRFALRLGLPLALVPALAVALLLVLRSSSQDEPVGGGAKGGEASLVLVRERAGVLLEPTRFTPQDRFKAFVSCAPGVRYVDLIVEEGQELFYPLEPTQIECGNQVALPGAFSLEGKPLRVCIRIAQSAPPPRGPLSPTTTCLHLSPE